MMAFFLLTFTHLLTLVNPLGVIPFFLTLTDDLDKKNMIKIAFKACFTAFIALIVIGAVGKYIFDFFGISVHGLKIVGSIIFLINGYDMLNARVSRIKDYDEEDIPDLGNQSSISPLAIPMISGPGAMTAVMVAAEESKGYLEQSILFLAILLVLTLCFFTLVLSKQITAKFGKGGSKIFLRLMGLVLMMIAVEFFFSGLSFYVTKYF